MAFARHPIFQVKNGQKLPRPSALIFTSAAPLPAPERIVLPWGWQWDSAHHGPVFPGCRSKERIRVVRLSESWRSGKALAPSQAPPLALPLGRDHAPGGRLNRK